jgi:SAM-dependent methyltransferase
MSRVRELLQQLRFERMHGRAAPFALLRKLAMLIPNAVAFALFNFGSAFPRSGGRSIEASPRDPQVVPLLRVRAPLRGLPLSDSTAVAVEFDDVDLVEDVVFAMREIHRVARPGTRIGIALAGRWWHPVQQRVTTPEMIRHFSEFQAVEASSDRIVLQAIKAEDMAAHPRRIDLGCGGKKRPGYTGIDVIDLPGVDIVRDVDRHGLPFSANTVAAVYASHFFEHVRDLVFVMNEIHRVCCDGAEVEIVVPTLLGPWAAADPTHLRLFNARSFGYFTGETEGAYAGIEPGFALLEQRVSTSMNVRLRVIKRGDTPAS